MLLNFNFPYSKEQSVPQETLSSTNSGVFERVNQAIDAAYKSQQYLQKMTLSNRELLLEAIRKTSFDNAIFLSEMSLKETQKGNLKDKITKHTNAAKYTLGTEDIAPKIVNERDEQTIIYKAPFGVIASLIPSTNASETVINHAIGMIAAGNSVVFSAHPKAINTSICAVQLLNEAIVEVGGPANLLTILKQSNRQTTDYLMQHPKIDLIVVTGATKLCYDAINTGKKAICAGAGNPPVIVDSCCDIEETAKSLIKSCSFDWNTACLNEKEAFVLKAIYTDFLNEMQKNGAYLVDKLVAKQLEMLILKKSYQQGRHQVDVNYIGKSASFLLEQIGIELSEKVKVIIFETDKDNPFVTIECLVPILPIVKVEDIDMGIAYAVEAEGGRKHTASIYSNTIEHIEQFAQAIDVSLFVVNKPCYMGGGIVSYTIASITGEGMTSAQHFTKPKRSTIYRFADN